MACGVMSCSAAERVEEAVLAREAVGRLLEEAVVKFGGSFESARGRCIYGAIL